MTENLHSCFHLFEETLLTIISTERKRSNTARTPGRALLFKASEIPTAHFRTVNTRFSDPLPQGQGRGQSRPNLAASGGGVDL